MLNKRASISVTLIAALVATSLPAVASADERTIRCESGRWGGQRYCSADTDGRVELVRELSRRRCVQWRTWGYDKRGVWVDNGCRAEFRVGKDGGIGAGTGIAIGAVAGAAVIAAILANKGNDNHKEETRGAEDWMVGRFRGFSPTHDRDFEITVDRDGSVRGESQGDQITGHISKDRLHLGDSEFKLKKESWGFQATHKDDSKDVIYFRKQ